MRARVVAMMLGLVLAACSSSTKNDSKSCKPGTSRACTGAASCTGLQYCNAEGSGYDACICAGGSGGSAGIDGGGATSGGMGGVAGAAGAAGSLGVQHTLVAVADTYLSEQDAGFNYGKADELSVSGTLGQERVILVRFDLLQQLRIPTLVTSARLAITTGAMSSCGSDKSFEVYALREDWAEGLQNGAPGESNWNQRTANDYWSSPGAGPGSFESPHIGALQPTGANITYELDMTAAVEKWVSDSGKNFGITIQASSDGSACFASLEEPNVEKQPRLVVYTSE